MVTTWKVLARDPENKGLYCLSYTSDPSAALDYYKEQGWKQEDILFVIVKRNNVETKTDTVIKSLKSLCDDMTEEIEELKAELEENRPYRE